MELKPDNMGHYITEDKGKTIDPNETQILFTQQIWDESDLVPLD